MHDVWELHETAMELLDKASQHSNSEKGHIFLIQAFEIERDAAIEMAESIDPSTLRSILFYTAIDLAMKLNKVKEAHDLAYIAQQREIHKDFSEAIEKQRIKSLEALAMV